MKAASALVVLLLTSFALAQDPVVPKAPPPDSGLVAPDTAILKRALESALGAPTFHFEGDIKAKKLDEEESGSMRIAFGGSRSSGSAFTGGFEMMKTEGGDVVVASTQRVPGAIVLDHKNRLTVLSVFEEATVDPSRLSEDVLKLTNLATLTKAIAAAKPSQESDPSTGEVVWAVKLPKSLLKNEGGEMMGPFGAKIVSVIGRFRVDRNGALVRMTFDVDRSDPMAAFRRRAMEAENEGGGSFTISADMTDMDEENPVAAETVTYTFKAMTTDPSARLKAAHESAKKAIAEN